MSPGSDESPQSSPPGEQRASERADVAMKAQLRGRGFSRFTVTLLDLSTTGFRAEAAFDLHEGDLVWLTIPGMEGLAAHIAWRKGYMYGFKFDRALYPAVFERIVAATRQN